MSAKQKTQHAASVRPVRVSWWDEDLSTIRRRIIGYRAECECGYHSQRFRGHWLARRARDLHNARNYR